MAHSLPHWPPHWPQPDAPLFAGRYRATPEAFVVEELPGFEPSGAGEHLLLQVRKRGANTFWVAQELARHFGCRPADVGYCGEKDRHAVATQWFSLRDPGGALAATCATGGDGWQVLGQARHHRKLRRGEHAGNRFRLRLDLDGSPDAERVAAARSRLASGVANYFGPQRFGRDGANLEQAAAWVAGAKLPPRGAMRGRILSTARSLLFNEVVAARVRHGSLRDPVEGDVITAAGATGPLWGRGRSATTAVAAVLEAAALEPWGDWCTRLEYAGLSQERRALLLRPAAVSLAAQGDALLLDCELPPGAFVTSVLAALGDFVDGSGSGDGRDRQ